MRLIVARVTRPHGLRGEVSLQIRTDEPDTRIAVGSTLLIISDEDVLDTDREPQRITVLARRWQGDRLLVRFDGYRDRDHVLGLRGRLLVAEVDPGHVPEEPDEWFDFQLVGLNVDTQSGRRVGEVIAVVHLPGQDLLSVDTGSGQRMVPFAADLVPEVDLAAGRLVIADLPGLLTEDVDGGVPGRGGI